MSNIIDDKLPVAGASHYNFSVKIDTLGHVYVGGQVLEGYDGTGHEIDGLFVAQYDQKTGAVNWTRDYQTQKGVSDHFYSLFLAPDGVEAASTTSIVKFDADGNQSWATPINPGYAQMPSFAADSNGDIYAGEQTFITTGPIQLYYSIVKYSSETGLQIWSSKFEPSKDMQSIISNLTVSSSGDVLACGNVTKTSLAKPATDFLMSRFDGQTGVLKSWTYYTGEDKTGGAATQILADGNGDAFALGYIYNDATLKSLNLAAVKFAP